MPEKIAAPFRFLLRLAVRFIEDDGLASAGYLAYVGLMSLLPFIVFVFTLLGLMGQADQGTGIILTMFELMPSEVAVTLQEPVQEVINRSSSGVLTISILVVLWIAGSGVEGFRSALNRAYRIRETRSYWRRRTQSTILVVVLSGLILVAVACLIVGPVLWQQAEAYFDLGYASRGNRFPGLLRFGLGNLAMFLLIAVFYHLLPNHKPRWGAVYPGAAAVCVMVTGATSLLAYYLEHFSQNSAIYGSLGGVISTMIFFYLLGAIFVIGAEFNAMLAERRAKARVETIDE